ncbi:MAG TPA: hypothetical protein VMT10_07330 [Solirubrobacteraceae bacterium]|nr:hypothetical protein [Solirubrobacteraceae bacterium]
MTTLTVRPPDADAAHQLATDLGEVLDALLERTAGTLVERLQAHELSAVHWRTLRCMDRSLVALHPDVLAERTQLEPRVVTRAIRRLRERDLVIDVMAAHGDATPALALTRRGRAIVHDLDHARRRDLRGFVEGLEGTERRRVEAAVSLLSGEL